MGWGRGRGGGSRQSRGGSFGGCDEQARGTLASDELPKPVPMPPLFLDMVGQSAGQPVSWSAGQPVSRSAGQPPPRAMVVAGGLPGHGHAARTGRAVDGWQGEPGGLVCLPKFPRHARTPATVAPLQAASVTARGATKGPWRHLAREATGPLEGGSAEQPCARRVCFSLPQGLNTLAWWLSRDPTQIEKLPRNVKLRNTAT